MSEQDSGYRYHIVRDDMRKIVEGSELRDSDIIEDVEVPDTREQLEADVREWVDIATYKAFTPERMLEVMLHWLDRQAAITRAEVFADGEYDCMTCDAKAELREQVDEYSRGWAKANMGWAEASAEAERWRQKCDKLKAKIDELTAERDRLQRVAMVQADSFKSMEAELKAANDTCNTLRASVAGLKMTVEKRRPDPVEIQAQLAKFADEWARADTRIQEQRLIACYAKLLSGAND